MTHAEEIAAAECRGAQRALQVAAKLFKQDTRSDLAKQLNYQPVAYRTAQICGDALERFAAAIGKINS